MRFIGCSIKMLHTKIRLALVVTYLLPMMITCSHGYLVNNDDKKFILVDPYYYDFLISMKDYDLSNSSGDYDFGSGSGDQGADGCISSRSKQFVCKRLDKIMPYVESNTIIAINSTTSLDSSIVFKNVANISIIGYNKFIEIICFNTKESVIFMNCSNITIENVLWNHCSYSSETAVSIGATFNFDDDFRAHYSFGLSFIFCTDITIKSCTFKNTLVEINTFSGTLCMDCVKVLSRAQDPIYKHFYYVDPQLNPLPTGIILNQTNQTTKPTNDATVKITNSLFSQNNSSWDSQVFQLLLFYILVDDPDSTIQVHVRQTNFSSASYNSGWPAENGMVWMRMSCRDANIKFYGVKFVFNKFSYLHHNLAPILHINITTNDAPYTVSNVLIESCSFSNNSASKIAQFEGDMHLGIINTHFSSNEAQFIIFVETNFHEEIYYPYGEISRYITTSTHILRSNFYNNIGGHLMCLNGTYILAIISELQISHNVLLPGYNGFVVFQNYDTLGTNISNIKYESNSIRGTEGSGFHFKSRQITITPNLRYFPTLVLYEYPQYTVCIPLNFQLNNLINQDTFDEIMCKNFTYDYQRFSFTNGSFINNTGGGHGAIIHFDVPQFSYNDTFTNVMSTCTFKNNSVLNSLIYMSSSSSATFQLTIKDCIFKNNVGTVLYAQDQIIKFINENSPTVFDGNQAENGVAVYLDSNSILKFSYNARVSFSNNIARRYGGAIYYNTTQSSNACYKNVSTFIVDDYRTSVEFTNNIAGIAGGSIYFSISQSCNGTLQYDAQTPFFRQLVGEIATSPNILKLYYPAQLANSSDPSTYYISDIMLGQNIIIPACVLDHNEMPAGSVQFTVHLVENNDNDYSINGSDLVSVDCKTLQGINNLVITGRPPLINSTLTIQLSSFYDSRFDWKPITVILDVQLSSCHSGFYYSNDLEYCVCYTTDNIVTCSGSNSTIRNGYWFGTINEQPTVTVCPINYCNFDNCEATTGTCDLYPLRDNQCRAHRSGAACGNCEEGYTLSFDSIDCISMDSCNVGQTVLVITMSFLYWIAVIAVVFGMMYFKIKIGYLYGITFYYSIIDIILEDTLLVSDSLYQLVTTLASFTKILPQFLGRLCFVKGLSGIDQQFIHYLHPFAILFILWLISICARFSRRLTLFLSRAVLHAICLLLLLSYSSIASTSLLLVRAIRFTSVDKVYSYLSPDIEYFHGRHLAYGLIALVIGLIFVIGLPLLLLLEPFVNSKINFIKIKPLLDQFQGCYKDRFRYFASFFMIFRLMILSILAINETNLFITLYSLLGVCLIMILIHVTAKPYNNNVVNFFDSFMLLILVLVIALQMIETYHGFSSNSALGIDFALVVLPLFVFLLLMVYLNAEKFKKLIIRCISFIKSTKAGINDATEMDQHHNDRAGNANSIIIDNHMRRNATVVDM